MLTSLTLKPLSMINHTLSDCIHINQLQIPLHIGVHAWEKNTLQKLTFDLRLFLKLSNCQDNIKHTVSYQTICEDLSNLFSNQHYELIETVAENACQHLLSQYPIHALEILVKKYHVIPNCNYVAVQLFREKSTTDTSSTGCK